MSFDFETPLAMDDSRAMKWRRYAGRDVLPMWVADMDFQSPPAVMEALRKCADFGHFGYSKPEADDNRAIVEHLAAQYDWQVAPEAIVWLPGLVVGLNLAVRTACRNGEPVVSATPVYPPFLSAPGNQGASLRRVPLLAGTTRWEWDWSATDKALEGAGLWLLCHPHNPVGRLWDADELARIAVLAEQHDLIVCSDEIHAGLVLDPARRHVPLVRHAPALAARTITLMAPSKTFNVPGLGAAFAIIPDAALRQRFNGAMAGLVPHVSLPGIVATVAALREGEAWRQALLPVLRRNAQAVENCVNQLPGLRTTPVEATYLSWIDCREWASKRGINSPAAHFERFGLGLSDGADFGSPGFVRLNFGCPPATLEQGLERLARAVLEG